MQINNTHAYSCLKLFQKFDNTAVKTNNYFKLRLICQKKSKLQDEVNAITDNNIKNQLYWGSG